MTVYRLVALTPLQHTHVFDAFDCRVVAQWGSVHSLHEKSIEYLAWTMGAFRVSGHSVSKTAQPGNVLICAAQLDGGAVEQEQDGRQRTAAAVGAVLLTLGENAAYSLVSEQLILPTGKPRETLIQVRNPHLFPEVSESQVQSIFNQLDVLLSDADEPKRTKVAHALRWLAQGMHADDTDAYVAMWIALEVLCLDGTTNVRPINELLAAQYSIAYREACERFLVGRLHGIRSRIVHHGANVEIPVPVRVLLRAILFDCVFAMLGQRSSAARDVLQRPETEIAVAQLLDRVCTRPYPVGDPSQRPCPCGSGLRLGDCHGGSGHSA